MESELETGMNTRAGTCTTAKQYKILGITIAYKAEDRK
jgi:hypothetical protein